MPRLQSLGDILDRKQSASPVLRSAVSALVVEEANKFLAEIWGADFLSSSRAVYLKKDILHIAFLSSAAAQEIKMFEKEIMIKINNKFGRDVIKKIRYLA